MSFKLTDFITVSNTGVTTFGADGILINRTGADAYLFFQKSGTNRGAIYGGDASDSNGLRFFIGNNSDPSLSIVSNGSVGIGTASPSTPLHVNGNIIAVENATPAFRLIGSTTSFDLKSDGGVFKVRDVSSGNELYHIAAGGSGYHKWYINDSLKMTLDSSGNVGIGVSPTALRANDRQLQIKDATSLFQLDGISSAYLAWNAYYDGSWKRHKSGFVNMLRLNNDNNGISFYQSGNGSADSAITFTEPLTITSGGNVGIGTTSPSSKLHIVSSGGTEGLRLNAGTSSSNFAIIANNEADNATLFYVKGNGDTSIGGKLDVTTSLTGFASTITNNKDDSQGLLVRTSDNDGGEYILDLQSSSTATGTDYASKFQVAKGGQVGINVTPASTRTLLIKGRGTDSSTAPFQINDGNNADILVIKDDKSSTFSGDVEISNLIKFVDPTAGTAGTPQFKTLLSYQFSNVNALSTIKGGNEASSTNGTYLQFFVNSSTAVNTPLNLLTLQSSFNDGTNANFDCNVYQKSTFLTIDGTTANYRWQTYNNASDDAYVINSRNKGDVLKIGYTTGLVSTGDLKVDGSFNSNGNATMYINGAAAVDPSWIYWQQGSNLRWLSGLEGSSTDFWFLSYGASGNGMPRLILKENGNVGIGTTTLDSNANLTVLGNYATDFIRNFQDGVNNRGYALRFGAITASSGNVIGAQIVGGLQGSNTGGELEFYTKNSGTLAERMRIRDNGWISAYGSMSLNGGLHVGTTSYGMADSFSLSSGVISSSSGWYDLRWNPNTGVVFHDGSCRLIKENIIDSPYGLDTVLELKPRKYYRIDGEKEEIGFVADEVENIIPELVTMSPKSIFTKNDDDTEIIAGNVDYGKITAVLTKAIQEQQTIIESQKSLIDSLTTRIEALED